MVPHCTSQLDHLVIAAESLSQGVGWFAERSGVTLPFGGRHPLMGTYNHLSQCSDSSFLEIISIDPEAPVPARPRWFALDSVVLREQLRESSRLLTWVVGTNNLEAALDAARKVGIDAGEPIEQVRDHLRWRLAVRADGSLAENGSFPMLIEWPPGPHPASGMTDQAIRVDAITLRHPEPVRLQAGLDAIGAAHLATVKALPKNTSAAIGATLSVGSRTVSL